MSRIDNLIKQYAPDGVEYKALGDVAVVARERIQGSELDGTTYVGVDNLLPNFGGRKDSDYGANSSGAIRFREGDVLLGNIRPYLKKVWFADRDGGASPDVLTISLLPVGRERLMPKFLYYLLASDPFIAYSMKHSRGAKMPRGDKKATLAYRIPVPPLGVQHEIVSILDAFTELEAELEAELGAELDARGEQLRQYRSAILSEAETYQAVRLAEVAFYENGKAHERFVTPDGDVALMTARFVSSGIADRHVPRGDVLTRARRGDVALVLSDLPNGRALARTFLVPEDGRYAANQRVCLLRSRDPLVLDAEYFSRFMDRCPQLLAYNNGIDQTHLRKGAVLDVRVHLPPIEIQRRIASRLGELDQSIASITAELEAEILARRQQYAYYRDRLLSFEEAA